MKKDFLLTIVKISKKEKVSEKTPFLVQERNYG